jgi:hypothetical protein
MPKHYRFAYRFVPLAMIGGFLATFGITFGGFAIIGQVF